MSVLNTGTSAPGYQSLLKAALQTGSQYAITFPSVAGFTPVDVGYWYIELLAATTSTVGLVCARGILYTPGVVIYTGTAISAGFGAFNLVVDWKVNALGWSAIAQ